MKRRARSEGFTLVEVLVSMSVMGLIATVISSVVIVAVRHNPAVHMRTDAARTLQGITTWLPQDVDSTPPGGFDVGKSTVSGCASSPGANVLRMQWSENISGTTTQYIANYRYVASGTQNLIQRVSCNGTGALPLANTTVQRVSGPLAPMPGSWQPGNPPAAVSILRDLSGDVEIVTMQLLSENNLLLGVEAAPKNPANTLPPAAAEVTTPPAATTSTTTTTIPATTTTVAPCVVMSSSMSSSSIKNTPPPPEGKGNSQASVGVLAAPLTITVLTTGYCTGLLATPARGAPNGELFRNFSTSNGTTYTVTFPGYPQGSSELWADGSRTITFSSSTGGPYGSVTLQVT